MVSTPDGFTGNSPMSPRKSVTVKNTSARKSLCHFFEALDVKPKTSVCRFCAAKSKRKVIRFVSNEIKKAINRSKKLFTIDFYNIIRS